MFGSSKVEYKPMHSGVPLVCYSSQTFPSSGLITYTPAKVHLLCTLMEGLVTYSFLLGKVLARSFNYAANHYIFMHNLCSKKIDLSVLDYWVEFHVHAKVQLFHRCNVHSAHVIQCTVVSSRACKWLLL